MSVIDNLIFDRTSADVERVYALKNKILTEGLAALSTAEKNEYLNGMRGAYNYTDMNRVGQAVEYIANRFITLPATLNAYRISKGVDAAAIFNLPYDTEDVSVAPKTNWVVGDTPTQAEVNTYLANLSNLRGLISLPSGTPYVPSTMNSMSFTVANNIERLLQIIDMALSTLEISKYKLIDSASRGYFCSAEIYCGEMAG